ncbi:sodium/glutamate symporter [Ancylobacter sp. 6x-1]|uniref:Sodium/glutamate symporter n=1 Tax=Ancylobacter crimeensis TaxID=2579147 RepID=A0ABT0D6I2_9HYPH|nr:sodium/glutamate symporter [Ancylobacter crimeensis]
MGPTSIVEVSGLTTFTIAILVFFAGAGLNQAIPLLRRFNIPEAVTGGLIAALTTLIIHRFWGLSITFDLDARDMLLLYFFTGIGLNAKLSDLIAGGRPLLILLALAVVYLVVQNLVALGGVALLGLPSSLAVFLGSASLVGGHGTTIAWAPVIAARTGLMNGLEVGIATATLGLVMASLAGGPIARYLIQRNNLKAAPDTNEPIVGLPDPSAAEAAASAPQDDISHVSLLRTVLVLNAAILIGLGAEGTVESLGFKLPTFVVCLLVAIVLTNTVPRLFPRLIWPTRTRALALISDLSLNVFLAMSLMSMQLWAIGGLGPALVLVLGAQTLVAVLYILFVVFPAMGRDYFAAVIAAGFTGVSLGATPTAIANMTAVTKLHGAAPRAFIILPLVSAFFIDLVNAVVIGFMIR